MIRLETIQALCEAFYITIPDFLEVLTSAAQKSKKKTRDLKRRRRHVNSDESVQRSLFPEAKPAKRKVDFAAFYPDARKFSSNSIECEKSVKPGKEER